MLDFYPADIVQYSAKQVGFSQWFSRGYITVHNLTDKSIEFSTSKFDLASAFYVDVEFLINHAYEHLIELMNYDTPSGPRSDAWSVVTAYYFGFFSAQAILRLLGKPTFFANDILLESIEKTTGAKFSKGLISLERLADESATQSRYLVKFIKKGRPHETTWERLQQALANNVKLAIPKVGSNPEVLFYQDLMCSSMRRHYGSNSWPSELRNRANYFPGYAYRLLQNDNIAKTKSAIDRWKDPLPTNISQILSSSLTMCETGERTFGAEIKVMVDLNILIFRLMNNLYEDLIARRGTDHRWSAIRKKFIKDKCTIPSHFKHIF